MTPDECLIQIAKLLESYPDVHVLAATHSDATQMSYITLSITSLQSFARLVHHCEAGANLAIKVSTAGAPVPKGLPIDVSSYRYYINVPDHNGRSSFDDPPGPLHILGIYLARDLADLGLLAAAESEKLQQAWHGYGTED